MTPRRRLRLTELEARAVPATITVDTLIDETNNAATTSLREALTQANAQAGADAIVFAAGLTGTIQLGGKLPEVTTAVTVTGAGADNLTLRRNAGGDYGILTVRGAGADLTLTGVTLTNGAGLAGGGLENRGGTVAATGCVFSGNVLANASFGGGTYGAGVFNAGTMTLTSCSVSDNASQGGSFDGGFGGGVSNDGTLTMIECVIRANSVRSVFADVGGGGLYNAGVLSLTGCTVSDNSGATGFGSRFGGGIYAVGPVTLSATAVVRNGAEFGGGLFAGSDVGAVTVLNSTFAGNAATAGGAGMYFDGGAVTLRNVTVADNNCLGGAGQGAGLHNQAGAVTLFNTIIARNTGSGGDVGGAVSADSSHNLIGNGAGLTGVSDGTNGNQVGTAVAPVAPLLGPIQNNGGPTQTMALLIGSPAIDAGADNLIPAGTDQRGVGFPRIRSFAVDLGAYELAADTPVLLDVSAAATVNELQAYSFTAGAASAYNRPVVFGLVGAPAGAAINPATGAFSWTPTEGQGPATYLFTVTAFDGAATASRQVTVVVREVNTAPVLPAVSVAPILRGETAAVTLAATDADIVDGAGNPLTYFLTGGPAGAAIDPETGAFSWTPAADTPAGDYAFPVLVRDYGSPSLSARSVVHVTVKDIDLRNGELVVNGTAGNDTITVTPAKAAGKLDVTLNKRLLGQFNAADVTGRIVVRGLAGDDRVTVGAKVTTSAVLDGGLGNDTLTGALGNDVFDGGAGNDVMTGGRGDDAYLFADGWGVDRVTDAGGADRLDLSAVTTDLAVTKTASVTAVSGANKVTATGIDGLTGGSGLRDKMTVPAGNNLFYLKSPNTGMIGEFRFESVEALAGGAGNDTLKMNTGASLAHSFDGGRGRNTLDYSAYGSQVTISLKSGQATAVGLFIDRTVFNVANVVGSPFDDVLVGDDGANVLTGGGGRDVLVGGKGADTLTGGAGDDIVIAGVAPRQDHSNPFLFIRHIRDSWIEGDDYADRVAALTSGDNDFGVILDATTVSNDANAKDSLTGGDGQDWFFTSAGDTLTDRLSDELRTVI